MLMDCDDLGDFLVSCKLPPERLFELAQKSSPYIRGSIAAYGSDHSGLSAEQRVQLFLTSDPDWVQFILTISQEGFTSEQLDSMRAATWRERE